MIRKKRLMLLLALFVLPLTLSPTSFSKEKEAGGPSTVSVDCAAGDSIGKALEDKGNPLTIEVQGICHEEVLIQRSDVTLKGTDPLQDGIVAIGDPALGTSPLQIKEGDGRTIRRVIVENLGISGGSVGVRVAGDVVNARLNNLEIFDNTVHGIQISAGVGLLAADLYIHGNGSANLAAFGGFLRCLNCRLENASFGGFTSRGVLSLGGGSISGVSTGLFAVDGASIYAGPVISPLGPAGIPVQATATALQASVNSSVMYGEIATNPPVNLSGSLVVTSNSFVSLNNANQQSIGTSFQFVGSSRFDAGGTQIAGDLLSFLTSQVGLTNGSSMSGTLSCFQGGDAFCEDPSLIGAIGGCASCQPASTMALGRDVVVRMPPKLPPHIGIPEMMELPKMVRD